MQGKGPGAQTRGFAEKGMPSSAVDARLLADRAFG